MTDKNNQEAILENIETNFVELGKSIIEDLKSLINQELDKKIQKRGKE